MHCGTNDTENKINMVKKFKNLVKEIDEFDKQNPPKVVISSLIERYDQDFNDDIANIKENFNFCVKVKVCLSSAIITQIDHV